MHLKRILRKPAIKNFITRLYTVTKLLPPLKNVKIQKSPFPPHSINNSIPLSRIKNSSHQARTPPPSIPDDNRHVRFLAFAAAAAAPFVTPRQCCCRCRRRRLDFQFVDFSAEIFPPLSLPRPGFFACRSGAESYNDKVQHAAASAYGRDLETRASIWASPSKIPPAAVSLPLGHPRASERASE